MASKDDALYSRPDDTHFLQQGQVLIDNTVGAGEYDAVRSHPQLPQCIRMPSRIVHRETCRGDRIPNLPANLRMTSNYENPAHVGFRDNEQHDFDEEDAFEDLLHSQLRAVVPIDGFFRLRDNR